MNTQSWMSPLCIQQIGSIGEAPTHLGLPESTLRYDEKKALASSHAERGQYSAAYSSPVSLVQPQLDVWAGRT